MKQQKKPCPKCGKALNRTLFAEYVKFTCSCGYELRKGKPGKAVGDIIVKSSISLPESWFEFVRGQSDKGTFNDGFRNIVIEAIKLAKVKSELKKGA